MRTRVALIFLLLGLALFVYLVLQLGPGQIIALLARIGWHFLVIAAIYGAYQLTRAAALAACLLRRGQLSYPEILGIRISGEAVQFLTFTGPFLGEPTKAWLLRRRGLPLKEAFAATLTEYLAYTFTSAALAIFALIYLMRTFTLAAPIDTAARVIVWAMAIFLGAAAVAIVARFYLIGTIIQGVAGLPLVRRWFRPDVPAINRMEDVLLVVLRDRPRQLLAVVAIELAAQFLLIAELWWILRAANLVVPLTYPVLIEGATKFISMAFFFIPGQVGAAEGAYAVLFDAIDLSATAGFVLSFVRRLRSLLVAGAGLAAMSLLGGSAR